MEQNQGGQYPGLTFFGHIFMTRQVAIFFSAVKHHRAGQHFFIFRGKKEDPTGSSLFFIREFNHPAAG